MAWREKIAQLSVGYFDNKIGEATGKEESYLYNQVNQDWAYAEFATVLYGDIIEKMADEGKTIDQVLNEIENDEEYLNETFWDACRSAEGL